MLYNTLRVRGLFVPNSNAGWCSVILSEFSVRGWGSWLPFNYGKGGREKADGAEFETMDLDMISDSAAFGCRWQPSLHFRSESNDIGEEGCAFQLVPRRCRHRPTRHILDRRPRTNQAEPYPPFWVAIGRNPESCTRSEYFSNIYLWVYLLFVWPVST